MPLSEAVMPYTIGISDDESEAWICFHTEDAVSFDRLRLDLKDAGVVCGIDHYLLSDLAEARQSGQRYCVARAIPPEDGIEYFFSRALERTPKRLPDGRVDFYNLDTIQNVVEQQILAAKIPPDMCKPGQTVTGKPIPPCRRHVPLPEPGPNVEVTEDGTALIAVINGHPVLNGNQLRVDSTYTHEGDVDFSIGNITCIGNLVITGDVKSGFNIRGAQDITIHGVVDGGTISAGGEISLYGNVFGKQKTEIEARCSVRGVYIDSAVVEAGQDIVLCRGVRRSRLKAARSIVMRGNGSSIVGGTAQACDRIISHDLGSDGEIPTHVEILHNVFDDTISLRFLRQLTVMLESDRAWMRDRLCTAASAEPGESWYRTVERCLGAMPDLIAYCKKRHQLCAQAPKPLGIILALGTAHPGVTISIGSASLQLTQPMTNVMFHQENGAIRVTALDDIDIDRVRAE